MLVIPGSFGSRMMGIFWLLDTTSCDLRLHYYRIVSLQIALTQRTLAVEYIAAAADRLTDYGLLEPAVIAHCQVCLRATALKSTIHVDVIAAVVAGTVRE